MIYEKIYIPIGLGCKTTLILNKLNLRYFSLPFDYLNIPTIKLCNILEDDFKLLVDEDYIKTYDINDKKNLEHIKYDDEYSSEIFMHNQDINNYKEYICRFRWLLSVEKRLTFVYSFIYDEKNFNNQIEEFNKLREIILKYNNIARFKLITINDSDSIIDSNIDSYEYLNIISINKLSGIDDIPNKLQNDFLNIVQDNKLHIVYTKFMIVQKEWLDKGFKKEDILDKDKLTKRIEILKKYYVKWIDYQTNKDFVIVIIIDKELDNHFINELRNIFNKYRNVLFIKYADYTFSFNYPINKESLDRNSNINNDINMKYINELLRIPLIDIKTDFNKINIDYLITTRIDDDDMLPKWYIDDIQKNIYSLEYDYKLFGVIHGYVLTKNEIFKF